MIKLIFDLYEVLLNYSPINKSISIGSQWKKLTNTVKSCYKIVNLESLYISDGPFPCKGKAVVGDCLGTWRGNSTLTCTVNKRPVFTQATRSKVGGNK